MLTHETNTSISLQALKAYSDSLTDESVSIKRIIRDPHMPYSYDALHLVSTRNDLEKHFETFHRKSYNSLMELSVTMLNGITVEILNTPDAIEPQIIEKASTIFNHQLFWDNLSPHGGECSAHLYKAINSTFHSMEQFKEAIFEKAKQLDGNGWIWVVKHIEEEALEILTTNENDNPLCCGIRIQGIPLIVIDLWEHAYKGKFEDNRTRYLENIWHLVNWPEVSRRYEI